MENIYLHYENQFDNLTIIKGDHHEKNNFYFSLLISACTNIPQVDVLDNIEKSERNKACMDMVRFKVLQVFEDGYVLA